MVRLSYALDEYLSALIPRKLPYSDKFSVKSAKFLRTTFLTLFMIGVGWRWGVGVPVFPL